MNYWLDFTEVDGDPDTYTGGEFDWTIAHTWSPLVVFTNKYSTWWRFQNFYYVAGNFSLPEASSRGTVVTLKWNPNKPQSPVQQWIARDRDRRADWCNTGSP